MNDKVLLCINCILEENHKSHELESLTNAKNIEMKNVERYLNKCDQGKEKIISNINNISELISQSTIFAENTLVDISNFYNSIHKLIQSREEKSKKKFQEHILTQQNQLQNQSKSLSLILDKINEHSKLFNDIQNQNPILFLKSSNHRKQLIQESIADETALNNNLQQINSSSSKLYDFNKDKEIQSLVKILSSSLKHESNHKQKDNHHNQLKQLSKALKTHQNTLQLTNNQQQQQQHSQQSQQSNNIQTNAITLTGNNPAVIPSNQSSKNHPIHKLTPSSNKKELVSKKSATYNSKDTQPSNSTQSQGGQKKVNQADSSSQSQKSKKSFNVLEDFKSESVLDDKQTNAINNGKISVFNKPLNNYQEMRNQMKEKLTGERDNTKSVGRDEQNIFSQIGRKELVKQQLQQQSGNNNNNNNNELKSKRSPTSMISLVHPPNPSSTLTSSLNSHPNKINNNPQTISLTVQSNHLTNRSPPSTTSNNNNHLSNSKNLNSQPQSSGHSQSAVNSGSKSSSKITVKQDGSKKQESKQKSINLDFSSQLKYPKDQISKKIPTQSDSNSVNNNNDNINNINNNNNNNNFGNMASESCGEMSEIICNTSEKNEENQVMNMNNSFKGEINTFLLESAQLRTNNIITPNLTIVPHQQSQSDTPMSVFNSSTNNFGISKLNTYGSESTNNNINNNNINNSNNYLNLNNNNNYNSNSLVKNIINNNNNYNNNNNNIINNTLSNNNNDTIYYNKLNDFSQVQSSSQFIYVFGGFTDNQQYTIDRYDLARNTWEQFDIMPTHRSKFCTSLLMNGNILMIGGKQDNLRVASIDEYNPRFKTFLKASLQLTSPKSGFGVVTKNDMVYVIGGNDGYNILDTVEVYDFVLKQVKQYPKMLEKRDELAVTQGLDGKIYAIGGFGGDHNACLNTAERYNPIMQQWESIAPLNQSRRALSAVTLPDGIYAIGGFDGNNYMNSVEKYDEYLNRWIYISSMNHSRCTASVLPSQNNQHIFVFGGFDNGPLDSVERFNVLNGTWELLQPMPNKRFMHCSQLIQK